MISLKTLVVVISIFNIIGLMVFLASSGGKSYARKQELHSQSLKLAKFEEPVLAFNILRKLDRYQKISTEYYNTNKSSHSLLDDVYMGLKRDENYCLRARGYFIDHPEMYFSEKNFLSDYNPSSLVR